MAYEHMTYPAILQRMKDIVTKAYPNLDAREGSIIFNALAPAAVELAIMYTELDNILSESFIDTATREYILIACEQMGMDTSVFQASKGVHRAEFNVEVPIDSTWNCELYNYTVTEFIGMSNGYYAYRMECDTVGTAPNNQTGDLIPIDVAPVGLTYAKLVECLIEGENETSDDGIRSAYYEHVNSTLADGNVAQYQQWCNEYVGIGNSKVIPLWNGANTVKVSILSASNKAASEELVKEFQDYLDPGSTGMGDGVAPIGAIVTVTTATEIPISVTADISFKDGYSDTTAITTALENYFSTIAYEKNIVSYMTVGATILSVIGVDSISNLKINNGTVDISLGIEEIPVVGTTTWTVV